MEGASTQPVKLYLLRVGSQTNWAEGRDLTEAVRALFRSHYPKSGYHAESLRLVAGAGPSRFAVMSGRDRVSTVEILESHVKEQGNDGD